MVCLFVRFACGDCLQVLGVCIGFGFEFGVVIAYLVLILICVLLLSCGWFAVWWWFVCKFAILVSCFGFRLVFSIRGWWLVFYG